MADKVWLWERTLVSPFHVAFLHNYRLFTPDPPGLGGLGSPELQSPLEKTFG